MHQKKGGSERFSPQMVGTSRVATLQGTRKHIHIFTLGREFAGKSSTEQPSAGEWYGDMSQGQKSRFIGAGCFPTFNREPL